MKSCIVWTGLLILNTLMAAPAYSAMLCPQAQNQILHPPTSGFFGNTAQRVSRQMDAEMDRAESLIRQLEHTNQNAGLVIEPSLIETLQTVSTLYRRDLAPGAAENKFVLRVVEHALGFSKQFYFLEGEHLTSLTINLLEALPANAHPIQIKGRLYDILGHYGRLNPSQAKISQDLTDSLNKAAGLSLDLSKLRSATTTMPRIRSLQDYRNNLFAFPIMIQEMLGVQPALLQKIVRLSTDYRKAKIPNADFHTAAQDQAVARLKVLMTGDPVLKTLPEELVEHIAARIANMNTVEGATMVLAEIVSLTNPSLEQMVSTYQLLLDLRHQLDVQMISTPAGRPH